jgi:hypothetical protein
VSLLLLYIHRCCSIDGDADRLVYFQLSGAPGTAGTSAPRPVALLDGDKIAALAACLVKDLVAQLPEQDRQGIKVRQGEVGGAVPCCHRPSGLMAAARPLVADTQMVQLPSRTGLNTTIT